jgi:hypothetical protein
MSIRLVFSDTVKFSGDTLVATHSLGNTVLSAKVEPLFGIKNLT